MSVVLSPIELMIVRILMTQNSSVFAGTIMERHGVSYRDLINSLNLLESDGFVSVKDTIISITRLGRKWALENQDKFRNDRMHEFSKVPEKIQRPMLQPFAPYVPRISKLDPKFFALHAQSND